MITFLFLLISCFKPQVIDHADARKILDGKNCLEELKSLMLKAECSELQYHWLSDFDIMFQCHKPFKEKKGFWDNYIFRMAASELSHYQSDKLFIERNTICNDGITRIIAYHPDTWSSE